MSLIKKPNFLSGSIRTKCLALFTCAFAVILVVSLSMNKYSQNLLQQQAVDSTRNTLSLYMNFIDEDLEQTSSFLISFLLSSENYEDFLSGDSSQTVYQSIQNIRSSLQSHLSSYPNIGGLFFYSSETDQLIMTSQGIESFSDRSILKTYIKKHCASPSPLSFPQLNAWVPVPVKSSPFLLETAQYGNVYIGAWCTENFLSEPLNDFVENTQGNLFLSYADEYGVSHLPLLLAQSNITYEDTSSSEYLSADVTSSVGNYTLYLALPQSSVLKQTSVFNTAFLIFCVLVMAFLSLLFGFFWRQLYIPVQHLTDGMRELKGGNFNTILPLPKKQDEFTLVTETFNEMSQEIQDLKIAIYEEKLHKAHLELQYLTLQIKPHFFLNSLSIIHSLAMTRQYSLIMEMASCLMNYFRYAFRVSDSFVYVSEELDHVRNYLRIQELRYRYRFHAEFQIAESLDTALIPILTIHTFVENVIKHAYLDTQDMYLKISISATCMDQIPYLQIEIQDNGCGFSQESLTLLNTVPDADSVYGKKHIGISNVKQRLRLVYHDAARISFSNNTQGANVTLLLPKPQI